MRWLANSGFEGSPRDKMSPGLRSSPHGERTIYFRIVGNQTRIVRVVHQRRDVSRQRFD